MHHVGIDLGKSALDVCVSVPGEVPRSWPVHHILYEPGWDDFLRSLVPPGAVITVESTGFHYMLPVVQALHNQNCVLWQMPTTTTGKIRAVQISGSKSDQMDARALALAATWIAAGEPVRGAYPFNAAAQLAVMNLRQHVTAYFRAKKEATRASNRLDQLAFSIWPTLAEKKDIYLRAVDAGFITPSELRHLVEGFEDGLFPSGYEHGNARNSIVKLVATLPPYVTVQPAVEQSLREIAPRRADAAQAEVDALAEIERLVTEPPFDCVTRRWMTVPDASLLSCACLHVASNARIETYSVDEFKTACGIAPQRARSGVFDKRGKLRPGYRPAMVMTWFWTMRLIKADAPPNPVRDYYEYATSENRRYSFKASVSKLVRVLWGVSRAQEGYVYGNRTLADVRHS